MTARFHFPVPLGAIAPGSEIELPAALAHHALRVLRLREGERVLLFDGEGGEYAARLRPAGKRCHVLIEAHHAVERESPLPLVLVQALASGDKMDWVVQKAVELGVSAIVPVQAERSVLRLSGERAAKRRQHWQQIVSSACEQSGRNRLPVVAEIQPLTQWLADWRQAAQSRAAGGCAWVLGPGGGPALGSGARPLGSVHVLIGPEGGWSESEWQACLAAGCAPASLGPRVLRTETAGLAALAVLQARWGDFAATDTAAPAAG